MSSAQRPGAPAAATPSRPSPFAAWRWRPDLLDLLLLGAPVAIATELLHGNETLLFFASGLAIMPMARTIGNATEALAEHVGSAMGGLLNATFGNATELIIAFFALQAGLYEVVKASLVGSILGNVLVVLGISFLAGGWKRLRQQFNPIAARAAGAQLAVAAGAILVPAVLAVTSSIKHDTLFHLSIATALVLLLSYAAGLFFSLRTHAHLLAEARENSQQTSGWSARRAGVVLLVATVVVAVLSELLVTGVKSITIQLGWTETFVGVVVIALLGNAAEHASAVSAAMRDQMDLALAISLGSATQIALFVAPVLVLLGSLTSHPIDLRFDTFEVVAVVIAVALVNLLISDGESTWLEGVQLLAIYAIVASAFFVHP